MRAPWASATLTALTFATLAATARAEVERFSVDYQADAGCPPEDAFVRELTARTTQAQRTIKTNATHHLRVRVHTAPGKSEGRLEIAETSGPPLLRKVDGQTCREVVSGLALIAALALDPEASLAPVDAPPPPSPQLAPRPSISPDAPTSSPVPPQRLPSAWRPILGAVAGGTVGILPEANPYAALFIELEKRHSASFRLSFAYGLPTTASIDERSARLDWAAVRVAACPVGVSAAVVWFGPCAGLDAGFVWGAGNESGGITQTSSGRWPWLAVAASLQARFDLGAVIPFLEAGALVPLIRERFTFENPTVELHRVAPIVGFVQLGVAVAF